MSAQLNSLTTTGELPDATALNPLSTKSRSTPESGIPARTRTPSGATSSTSTVDGRESFHLTPRR
jgi:hypothetical protein